MDKETFDCDLPEHYKKQIYELLKKRQRTLHFAIQAEILINNQKASTAIAAIFEHMLVIFKQREFKRLEIIAEIHQLEVISIELIHNSSIIIKTKDQKIIINSSDALRLSKYFIRNFIFSTLMTSRRYKLKIISSSFNDFPRYSPSISPSQMIQFSYNSFCSFYGEKYKHRIVRFVHYFLLTGNPIFDLSYIPLSLLDEYFLSHSTLNSLFSAVLDSNFFSGIQCSNSHIPHFLNTCANFFLYNTFTSVLSLPNCNLKTGGSMMANSIRNNKKINLQYLDLSNNNIEDIRELVDSLKFLNSSLFYLNLNDIFLDLETTTDLFNNIIENQKLHYLTHILINSSTIDSQILLNFSNHIKDMVKKNRNILTYLDLGSLNEGSDILFKTLADCQVPLECLKIAGSHLDSESINHFYIFLSNAPFLQELDISNTNFDLNQIGMIINLIQTNRDISSFTLHVNSMNLNGERLLTFISFFQDPKLVKWTGISLEDNDINDNDLNELIKLFTKMINLSWVNLSCNFTSSMKNLDSQLINLLSIPRLNFIGLRGNIKKNFKGKKEKTKTNEKKNISNAVLISFITALNNLNHPIGLDLRFNNLNDDSLLKLTEVVSNNKISKLLLECNKTRDFESLISLCRSIEKSNSVISFNFPLADFHNHLKPYKMRINKNNIHAYHLEMHHIDNARIRSLMTVMKNQTSFGYHSCLSFKHVSKLDNLIDESIINLNNFFKGKKPFKHSIFSETIGLPLPFQRVKQKPSEATNVQNYNKIFQEGPGSFYYVPELLIKEDTPEFSIQYNSLCLRRPGASTSFQIPDSISTMITDSLSSLNSITKQTCNLIKKYQSSSIVTGKNPNDFGNYTNSLQKPIAGDSIIKGYISKIPNQDEIIEHNKPSKFMRISSDSNTESFIRMQQSYSNFVSTSNSSSSSNGQNPKPKSHDSIEKNLKNNKNHSNESGEDEFEYYEYIIEEEEEEECADEIKNLYEEEIKNHKLNTFSDKYIDIKRTKCDSSDNFADPKIKNLQKNKYFNNYSTDDDYFIRPKRDTQKNKNHNDSDKGKPLNATDTKSFHKNSDESDTDSDIFNKFKQINQKDKRNSRSSICNTHFIDSKKSAKRIQYFDDDDTDRSSSNKKERSERKNEITDDFDTDSVFFDIKKRKQNEIRKDATYNNISSQNDKKNIFKSSDSEDIKIKNDKRKKCEDFEFSETDDDFVNMGSKYKNKVSNSSNINNLNNKKKKGIKSNDEDLNTKRKNIFESSSSDDYFLSRNRKINKKDSSNYILNGRKREKRESSSSDDYFADKRRKKSVNSFSHDNLADKRNRNARKSNTNFEDSSDEKYFGSSSSDNNFVDVKKRKNHR